MIHEKENAFPEQASNYYFKKAFLDVMNGYRDIFNNDMEIG